MNKGSNQRILLDDIIDSSIRGIHIRSEIISDGISVNYINIKDILPGIIISKKDREKSVVSRNEYDKAGKLKKGDIVITAKGAQFKAAVVDELNEGSLISLNVIGLRLISEELNPEFIVAYLNCPEGQAALHAVARGIEMPSINYNGIKSISIPTLAPEIQKTLVDYLSLTRKYIAIIDEEKKILEEIQQSLLFSIVRD